jgi:hypothetical protein
MLTGNPERRDEVHNAQSWFALRGLDPTAYTERGRREADRAVMRRVIDPDAPLDERAARRLRKLTSQRYRSMLARVLRNDLELGVAGAPLAPPVARLLARNADQAAMIAVGLECGDPDPRAVIETERLLQAAVPSAERLAWIGRLLAVG